MSSETFSYKGISAGKYIEGEIEAGGSFVGYNDLASRIAYYALSDMISSEALTLLQNSES